MRPVSVELLDTLRGSHQMDARARVVTSWQTGVNPDGDEVVIYGGDVQLDSSADIRGSCTLETDGTNWIPKPDQLLTPYGNELFIERAVVFGDGRREWVSQGYFRIDSVEQAGSNVNDPLQITAFDRMSGLVEAKLEAPRQFTANHTILQVFESLVLEVYPAASIVTDAETNLAAVALGRTQVVEQDRFAFLRDVTRAIGRVMYWNHRGELFVGKPPDPTEPVYTVDAGARGVLVSHRRSLNRESVFNAVVATGEAPDTSDPVFAIARDMSPTSPTYWAGKFGKVPRFYTSPLITTTAQAETAAVTLLQRSIGLPYQIDFQTIPNPALEPLDPVLVSTKQGTEVHILDKITLPLTAEQAQTATTREQTEIKIDVGFEIE